MKHSFTLLLITTLLLSINSIYSQSYIGKNIAIAKKQIRQDLIKNGFTIVKEENDHYFTQNEKTGEWDVPSGDFYKILLGEEIEIQIKWNDFMNVINVSAFSNKEMGIKKIKKIFHPEKWKFIETKYTDDYLYDGNIISLGGPYLNYKYGIQNYIKI
jgi:hypothetical protein